MSLRDALTAIMREHTVVRCSEATPQHFLRWALCEGCGWESRRIPAGEIRFWDETFRELDAAHVADLQIAYLRDNLAQHAEELGLHQELAMIQTVDMPKAVVSRRLITDWSRADD